MYFRIYSNRKTIYGAGVAVICKKKDIAQICNKFMFDKYLRKNLQIYLLEEFGNWKKYLKKN